MNRRLLMILALTMSFSAMADDKDNSTYKLGDEVRAWTDLQKSGQASDSKVQAMPGFSPVGSSTSVLRKRWSTLLRSTAGTGNLSFGRAP